jgi:hypothetical protein
MAIFTQSFQVFHLCGSTLLARADMMYVEVSSATAFSTAVVIPLHNHKSYFSPRGLCKGGCSIPVKRKGVIWESILRGM